MYLIKLIGIGLLTLALVGCETGRGQKEVGGALVGAAVGGLLGSQIGGGAGRLAATAGGTLLGAFLGMEAGKSLDRADRLHAERTAQQSLETARSGTTSTWRNPDSGHSGTFTPTNTYQSRDGHYCRDYQQTIIIDGKPERATGTACRTADGSWRIVNS